MNNQHQAKTKKAKQPNNVVGLIALYDGLLANLSNILATNTATDSKALAFLLTNSAFLILLCQTHAWQPFTIVSAILLILSALASLLVLWTGHNYSNAAVKLSQHLNYLNKSNKALILQLIADIERACDEASEALNKKAKACIRAQNLLIVGVAFSVLSFCI